MSTANTKHNLGYYPNHWPAEDGGPTRLQQPVGIPTDTLKPSEQAIDLKIAASRKLKANQIS